MPDVQLVAFDLDDTLTPSKSVIAPDMAAALTDLLAVTEACIISGGQLDQFTEQVIDRLTLDFEALHRLHLMPTCGTRYYRFDDGVMYPVYVHDLTDTERAEATAAIESEARRLGLWEAQPWGPIIEDRGSQVTFSALGQQAPLEAKRGWDPTGEKKEQLRAAVAGRLPQLEARSGGSTSVDITGLGVDKAYGIRQLAERTGIPLEAMYFVGDRLDEGGNDYPVKALGVRCAAVSGPSETVDVVRRVITELTTAHDHAAGG